MTVASTATLGGTGTINGAVNFSAGSFLAPGASPGTLTTGPLSLSGTTTSQFELTLGNTTAGGGINDLVAVNGNLTLDGTLTVTEVGGTLDDSAFYTLFTYTARSRITC